MRDLLVQIIEKQDFPVAARIFSMACFTFELDSFVHTHGSSLWGEKYNLEVHRVAGNGYEEQWCREFPDTGAIEPDDLERPMAMIHFTTASRPYLKPKPGISASGSSVTGILNDSKTCSNSFSAWLSTRRSFAFF